MHVDVNLHLSAPSCLLVVFSASLSIQCRLFYQRHWEKKTLLVVHDIWYTGNMLSDVGKKLFENGENTE
jgi:predicted amidophosphoribosyltransferase